MKKYILFICIFVSTLLSAQVGINTTDPHAQLEIKSSDQANPNNTDGILIPKVDAFPAINPTLDQDGMMVYLTTDIGTNLKGFYYWDNTNSVWKSISGDNGWGLTGNAGTDAATNFIGTTDDTNLVFKRNNEKSGLISYYNTSFGNNTLSSITPIGSVLGIGNSAFGSNSLSSITSGRDNTAVGFFALSSLTNSQGNTAIGTATLWRNTSGQSNTAIGTSSLGQNMIGSRNTGVGYLTLYNSKADNNTALGHTSMYENTAGTENVAVGVSSLRTNTTGSYNVANGYQALYYNTTGVYNVAVGKDAMFLNTTGWRNSAFGSFSLYKNSTGNYNSAFGDSSLYNNITGELNTANGNMALYANTTGSYNSAFGEHSLAQNTIGNYNSAFGSSSLTHNTTGSNNVAVGNQSLYDNDSGSKNVAFGDSSLSYNTIGNKNAAFGNQSLFYNSNGSANNAFGSGALIKNTTGTGNGGYGEEANPTTTTGWNNIGIGFHTLGQIDASLGRIYGNQIGYDNIAFGLVAGDRIGNNCNQSAFIGPFTNVIINDTNVSNSTAIGNGALVFQNNMMRLGNSAVTRIESQVGLTVVSDGRYKFNVIEEVKGLDFIKKLRPVVYQYDTEKMDREWMNVEFDTMAKHNPQILKDYKKASQIRYSGFIAQEVENAAQSINYEFSGLSKPENSDGHYGLDYASFVVPLVKSIQEQQEEIEDLKKQLASEKNKNNQIENRLKAIEEKLSK